MEMLMKAEMMTTSSHLLMFMRPYLFLFVFKNFGRKLLYDVALFSAVQQCKSAIIIYMLPPS